MWKLLILSMVQSLLLSGGQVFLKLALVRMDSFAWTREFWMGMLTNWWFLCTGVCFTLSTVLWMYILKNFPFSMAYPMVSFSYVFGMIAAMLVFHEVISPTRWVGILLIMAGCFFIAR